MSDVATILLLTQMELRAEERVRQFLTALSSHAPELMPERFGTTEPLRQSMKKHGVREFVRVWTTTFGLYWASGKRGARGGMQHAYYPQHEQLTIYCTYPRRRADLTALFQVLVDTFRPDIAGLHVNTTLEVEGIQVFGREDAFGIHANTFTILKGLPRLWWRTSFGKPYVEMFGRERLMSAPVDVAAEGLHESVVLQLSSDLHDCVSEPERMSGRRDALADYLGREYFAKPERNERIRLLEPAVSSNDPPAPAPKVPNFPDVDEWLQDRERRAEASERGEPISLIVPKPRPF